VSLLEKGVAIHHAGMMPILREMVELLFAKGYIKLLFATETFAVGINMPTKTVLFTDSSKFDGSNVRPLLPHEYTQMAGRAGRRGIDTIGYVVHLTNLFKNKDRQVLKTMLAGKPQTLVSKFKVSYHFVFNMIQLQDRNQDQDQDQAQDQDFTKYLNKSMIQTKIVEQLQVIQKQIAETTIEAENLNITVNNLKTPPSICEQYAHLQRTRLQLVNKKRKEAERELTKITDEYKTVEKDAAMVTKWQTKKQELVSLNEELEAIQSSLSNELETIINLLDEQRFLICDTKPQVLTKRGQIASHFKEVHCLIFADLIDTNQLQQFNETELVGILSCFTNVSTPEDKRDLTPKSSNISLQQFLVKVSEMYTEQQDAELRKNIVSGLDYSIHYDLLDYAMQWTKCETEQECKLLLQTISLEKDIFLGEFIKAILKINTIAVELEKVAEMMGDMAFLSAVKRIPALTLKYVATNQSLYI
jgi:superfamily II RNA helicase